MTPKRFDITIIGADAAGLAAAAIAAEGGASVLLIRTGVEVPAAFSLPAVPNAVWRQLGLQDIGFEAEPARARVLLSCKGERVESLAGEAENRRALDAASEGSSAIWPDFLYAAEEINSFLDETTRDTRASALMNTRYGSLFCTALASINEVLDDHFPAEGLKTLLASTALIRFGLAGDEPGSAAALANFAAGSWPMRPKAGSLSLVDALGAACDRRGVERAEGVVCALEPDKGKTTIISLETGEQFRARHVMASSAGLALAAGLAPDTGLSPLVRYGGARGFVRVTLNEAPDLKEQEGSVFFLADDREELAAARDDIRCGRIPEKSPFYFEVHGRSIYIAAPFCPAQLIDDEGARGWTGQDRQAFGRQLFDRVKERLSIKGGAASIDVRIDPLETLLPSRLRVQVPMPQLNEIAAATRLVAGLSARG